MTFKSALPQLAFALCLVAAPAFADQQRLDITDYRIFTLPDGATDAARITNDGEILLQGQGAAYVVRNGAISPVVLPADGVQWVFANGMNESGDIVGEYRDAGNVAHPFVILQKAFQVLADVDGRTPVPADINERRVITGAARKSGAYDLGFVLDRGSYVFFQCDASGHTNPSGINRNGDVAGTCGTYADLRGFVFRGGVVTFVSYPGAVRTRIWDINDDGDVVGDAFFLDASGHQESIAFLWRDGVFHDLAFPGTRQSLARSINNKGDVLGQATIVHYSSSGEFLGFDRFQFLRNAKHLP